MKSLSGVPFADALAEAAIIVDQLDDVLEYGLIFGNGDINAVVYCENGDIVMRLTKNDVWDARLLTEQDPPLPTMDLLKERMAHGGLYQDEFEKRIVPDGWHSPGPDSYQQPFPCPLTCGQLRFRCASEEVQTGKIDLARAVVTVDGDAPISIRALAGRNVFLIQTATPCALSPCAAPFLPPAETGNSDGVAWLQQGTHGDPDWPGMSYATAVVQVAGWTAVSIVTSLEAEDPCAAAVSLAKQTLANEAVVSAIADHEATWNAYWQASGVDLSDPLLSSAWYRALYFLRCVSKPGVISPGLFAGLTSDAPAWHGDYHLNYNLQQTFWAAYPNNHVDLAEPYDRLICEYLPRAQWLAHKVFNCEGAFYPHVLYAYEPPDPEQCASVNGRQYLHHEWGLTLGLPGFAVQPLWWGYLYEPNRERLAQVVYPPLREVALFYASFLENCPRAEDGKAHFGPTVSPEHWGWTEDLHYNYNCTFDIAMARFSLDAAVQAATRLELDQELVTRWQRAADLLPSYPLFSSDPPVVVDIQNAPPTEYNITVPTTPVFPGEAVTVWSPEAEQTLFTRTIEGIEWNGNNSTFLLAVARARLSMPQTVGWLHEETVARTRPNGTLTLNRRGGRFNAFGHYTEQFAVAHAVAEMLLQSVGNIIRVFPAWPLDMPAAFRDLRAQGGFLVSASCRDGAVQSVAVRATVGGELRLALPWENGVCHDQDGKRRMVESTGMVSLATAAGDILVFSAAVA